MWLLVILVSLSTSTYERQKSRHEIKTANQTIYKLFFQVLDAKLELIQWLEIRKNELFVFFFKVLLSEIQSEGFLHDLKWLSLNIVLSSLYGYHYIYIFLYSVMTN